MEIDIYDREIIQEGTIDKISSLVWTRRYWDCGDFQMLVPYTDRHYSLLQNNNLIVKRHDNEMAEIKYIDIKKDSQGLEVIEVQGNFLPVLLDRRIVLNQIITTDNTQNILYRIVRENATNPTNPARIIPRLSIEQTPDIGSGQVDYASEPFPNVLPACETAAKAAKIGFRVCTDIRGRQHKFSVYKGKDLTAGNADGNRPCIFSPEFDNILEQEYTNSIESLKTAAYVGGEESENTPRKVVEVGSSLTGLDRIEMFVDASDIQQTYKDASGNDVTMSYVQYLNMLTARGAQELGNSLETLAFASKVNPNTNLRYREDFDIGDRVTCINKRWGIKIDVRITEIIETYENGRQDIEVTFGESLPALIDKIRKIAK